MPDINEQRQWFALTVKHQHERRVEGVLRAAGVDTFLPLYRARRQWSDRVKDLDAPLFPGYVFSRFTLRDRARVVGTPGVVRIVGFAGLRPHLFQVAGARNPIDQRSEDQGRDDGPD